MEKVVNISREKTALIIPNAIGIQTAEEKVWLAGRVIFAVTHDTYLLLNVRLCLVFWSPDLCSSGLSLNKLLYAIYCLIKWPITL